MISKVAYALEEPFYSLDNVESAIDSRPVAPGPSCDAVVVAVPRDERVRSPAAGNNVAPQPTNEIVRVRAAVQPIATSRPNDRISSNPAG